MEKPTPDTPTRPQLMVTKRKPQWVRYFGKGKQSKLKLDDLTSKLGTLSSSIKGIDPENILQIESPKTDTGYNTIAYQDQKGSKLILENLDPTGMVGLMYEVTYPVVQSLGQGIGWQNKPLDTIFVKLKLAGDPNARAVMAAKKMVLRLFGSYQSDLKFSNKLILKETQTSEPVGGEFVIMFSVKGRTDIEPITMPDLSKLKSSRPDSNRKAFTDYQEKLTAGVVNGFRIEDVVEKAKGKTKLRPNEVEAIRMLKEIKDAAQSLLDAMIPGKGRIKLDASELATLETLRMQVKSADKDDFKNELDTQRWKQWRKLNPLSEDQIVPGTRAKLGEGAQGPVFKYQLDPALRRRNPVVLKYDSNGLNIDAGRAGIPEENPQQSVRAVAAFKISGEHLQLGLIPRTEFFVGTDDKGRPKLGQAMEVVNGTVGQRTAGIRNDPFTGELAQQLDDLQTKAGTGNADEKKLARAKLDRFRCVRINGKWYLKSPIDQDMINRLNADQTIVANLGKLDPQILEDAQQRLSEYVKVDDRWYHAQNVPANIDYGDPVVQKGLSDLQVFDCIIGHADRNPGNWIYEKDNNNRIIGVKGIDNDDTFGKDWLLEGSKTPGIPPIVDISTALSILKANSADIVGLLAGLSVQEITTAGQRFKQVQQEVAQRIRDGKIASSIKDQGVQDKLLAELSKLTNIEVKPEEILRWGDKKSTDAHKEENSYLGIQILRKNLTEAAGIL